MSDDHLTGYLFGGNPTADERVRDLLDRIDRISIVVDELCTSLEQANKIIRWQATRIRELEGEKASLWTLIETDLTESD